MKNNIKSYTMFVCSMLIFGTVGIFRRAIPLSSGHLACMRGIVGALCIAAFLLLSGKRSREKMNRKDLALLIIGGALIGLNWMLLFEAYNYTTVPVATLCYYMEPTIVILLSPLLLREKLTTRKILCVAAAVVGMVLVAGVNGEEKAGSGSIRGILLGLGAAAVYSSVVFINKKVAYGGAYERTVIELASAGAVMIPYLLITGDLGTPDYSPKVIAMICVMCIVHTGVAYLLYFAGMTGMRGQSVALLSYIDPVSALLFAPVFLNETLSVWGIIGALMIIGAAIIAEIKKSAGTAR